MINVVMQDLTPFLRASKIASAQRKERLVLHNWAWREFFIGVEHHYVNYKYSPYYRQFNHNYSSSLVPSICAKPLDRDKDTTDGAIAPPGIYAINVLEGSNAITIGRTP